MIQLLFYNPSVNFVDSSLYTREPFFLTRHHTDKSQFLGRLITAHTSL